MFEEPQPSITMPISVYPLIYGSLYNGSKHSCYLQQSPLTHLYHDTMPLRLVHVPVQAHSSFSMLHAENKRAREMKLKAQH